MFAKYLWFFPFLCLLFSARAQTNALRISPNIVLPKDSSESRILIRDLQSFLRAAQTPNEENQLVLDTERPETFILLDELKGMEKSAAHRDDFFYHPYLTNVTRLQDQTYLIQVSYMGIQEDAAVLRASFNLLAHKSHNSFRFSSPLRHNTRHWKTKSVGTHVFHYQHNLNEAKVKAFTQLATSFDRKLKAPSKITEYYGTDNLPELQQLTGVDYKADYNGQTESVWSAALGDRKVVVLGNKNATFSEFDPHDLFHDRLSLVIARSKVNKPVDEGCAYLYGGSWGYTWPEIFRAFREQVASNKNTDWTEVKEKPVSFRTGKYPNSADYVVNGLLVRKIEKEKGFAGVWELLNVGPYEKGNEKYYQTLEKLTGITRATYNEKVWELINSEK